MDAEKEYCVQGAIFLKTEGLVGENNLGLESCGCGRIENLKPEIEGIFSVFEVYLFFPLLTLIVFWMEFKVIVERKCTERLSEIDLMQRKVQKMKIGFSTSSYRRTSSGASVKLYSKCQIYP